MKVNRFYFQVLAGKLLIHRHLRELPSAMDVIGAELNNGPPAVNRAGLDAIVWSLVADFIPYDRSHTATQRQRFRHEA